MHGFHHHGINNLVTQRNAQHRKRFPFNKNVAKKVGNARACGSQFRKQLDRVLCIFPQVRQCRRRAGGIAVRCVTEFLRNDENHALVDSGAL